ncbi:MAG: Spy/CpxP family protein refolding chaperone [Ignavibacteria bacterium]|nr:Spy/CpxP family protein refolding chaperone [Ignavibacteria bacterium]
METISKNKLLFTIILVLILINVGTLSFMWYGRFKGPHPPPPPPPPPGDERQHGPPPEAKMYLKEQLKLTDSQMEAIDKIRDSHISQIHKLREETHELKDKLFSNLSNPDIDSNKLKEITTQIGNNEARVDLIAFDNFREVRKLCTDEQKKKFDEIILDVMRMNAPEGRPGGDRRGPPPPDGRRGPPPEYKQRDGDGHVNSPGMPEQKDKK